MSARLTKRQKDNILSAYAAGGVSQRDLAAKYGVSISTINNVLKAREDDDEFATKVKQATAQAREAEYTSLVDFFEKNKGRLASRIAKALDVSDEEFEKASVRDRAQYAKTVADIVIAMKREREQQAAADAEEGHHITFVFADTSAKLSDEEGGGSG